MTRNERGFTLVEVLIAVVILAVGVLALASGAGLATRLVGRGRATTYASQIATDRLEYLRSLAGATAVPCTHVKFINSAAPVVSNGVTTAWTIEVLSPTQRLAKVAVSYRTANGERKDTVSTVISCT